MIYLAGPLFTDIGLFLIFAPPSQAAQASLYIPLGMRICWW